MRSEEPATLTRTQRARRDDIVAAAIAIINEEGYAAASVSRIADRAGASKGTVLYHFKSKDAMAAAVVPARGARARLQAYVESNLDCIRSGRSTSVRSIRSSRTPTSTPVSTTRSTGWKGSWSMDSGPASSATSTHRSWRSRSARS